MRCYSHLSDDEREQIGLSKALGHSIGAIAQAIGRPKSTSGANSPATGCRAGATRRFTPPELINCAGGVKRGSKEIEPYGPSLSTGSRKGWTPEKIAGWLTGGNEPALRAVGCETIYAFIYRAGQ